MGDRDDYKSKKYREKSRKRKRYDDDEDDDDYKHRDLNRNERHSPKKNVIERILTPGQTANNLIKTTATGMILGSTVLLMGIYGWLGENIAGASSLLPIATVLSGAATTACVWIFGRPKTEEANNAEFSKIKKELARLNSDLDQLEAENEELEQRLATVEMLESFEDKLAKRTLDKQTEDKPNDLKRTSPKSALESKISSTDEGSISSSSQGLSETE